jgi:hypothetical protein
MAKKLTLSTQEVFSVQAPDLETLSFIRHLLGKDNVFMFFPLKEDIATLLG